MRTPRLPPNKAPGSKLTPSLIRWPILEIRFIAIRLAQRRIHPTHVIVWSLWRRARQATARMAHVKQKIQL